MIKANVRDAGIDEAKIAEIKKNLEDYKKTDVKIAVIGQSGTGKSTFINKLRGFLDEKGFPEDPEPTSYAAIGRTQTTMEVREYPFIDNNNIRLFDLPGAGTLEFPINEYEEKVKFKRYDAFILLTSARIYENDITIYEKIKRDKKPFLLARTQVDNDLESFWRGNRKSFTVDAWENECMKLRRYCVQDNDQGKSSGRLDYPAKDVYLISCMDYKEVNIQGESKVVVDFKDNSRLYLDIIGK